MKDFAAPAPSLQESTSNGKLLFTASDGVSGEELWESDGTVAGTVLLKDISAGAGDSGPSNFTAFNNQFCFTADDGIHGNELWRTDGTIAGTTLVADVFPGTTASAPSSLTVFQGALYFAATTPLIGRELWRTDGTAPGTSLVADIAPGIASSNPTNLTVAGDTLYFNADDGIHGQELWQTDGTTAATTMVQDINVDGPSSVNSNTTVIGNNVFFVPRSGYNYTQLWVTRPSGTIQLTRTLNISSYAGVIAFQGDLYFLADQDQESSILGLYRSDGTVAGTTLVQSLGAVQPAYQSFTIAGGILYFTTEQFNQSQGTALYSLYGSDGTTVGTSLVYQSPAGLNNFTELNNRLYFFGQTLVNNSWDQQLFTSNGTAAGTVLIQNLGTQYGITSTEGLAATNSSLFFLGGTYINNTNQWALYASDGTTNPLTTLYSFPVGEYPSLNVLTTVGGLLYFSSRSNSTGATSLFVTNGTNSGTLDLQDETAQYGYFHYQATVNGNVIFFYSDATSTNTLSETNGTLAGTTVLKVFNSATPPTYFTALNDKFYFGANDGVHGQQLWQTDGTAAGTTMVTDIVSPSGASFDPSYMTAFDGGLYFNATTQSSGDELWKSDGTSAGTVQVADIFPGITGSNLANFQVAGTEMYFYADDGVHGMELWKSDGTTAGTVLVQDINTEPTSSNSNSSVVVAGSNSFFVWNSELWVKGSSGTIQLTPALNGLGNSVLTPFNGNLYFFAQDANQLTGLYRSDGTVAGTYLIQSIGVNAYVPSAGPPVILGGKLYFTATTTVAAGNLFVLYGTDGTSAGTSIVFQAQARKRQRMEADSI